MLKSINPRLDYSAAESYLEQIMSAFKSRAAHKKCMIKEKELEEKIFSILASREFCYLSKKSSKKYRSSIVEGVSLAISQNKPIQFFYDIGGGYHASLNLYDKPELCFYVGLGELFILHQIKKFTNKIGEIYPIDCKFHLIIDDKCAQLANDTSIEKTERYSADFKDLIKQVGMNSIVDVILESELFNADQYKINPIAKEEIDNYNLTLKEHENVIRFLGRRCSKKEAIERILTYQQASSISESLLEPIISKGAHLTQRPTSSTFCFRAFPGSDSRIQCGQVALKCAEDKKIVPFLLTSNNFNEYVCEYMSLEHIIPLTIKSVIFAHKK